MAANRTRSNQFLVRMTDEEYAVFLKRLEKSKLKKNDFSIRCLLNHQVNIIENMPEFIRQLKAIGNNLNQIARAANSKQIAPPQLVENLEKGVNELWQWLRSAKAVKR